MEVAMSKIICFNISLFMLFSSRAAARRIAQEDEFYYKLPPPPAPPIPPTPAAFRPGITVIVGAIVSVFAITFILLLYVQHCRTGENHHNPRSGLPLTRVDSGVNRKVIQQLPLFRFASLRGQKDGLECAVCLTRFETEEVLRLLPKCKHAFHVECVDTWLDQHSTCPLCRYRVRPEDVLLIDCHGSSHKALHNYRRTGGGVHSARHSSAGERGGAAAGGEESRRRSSFDGWSSRRRRSQGLLSRNVSRRDDRLGTAPGQKHRLEHQIMVSDGGEATAAVGRREVQTAAAAAREDEVLYIRTEMLMGGGDDEEEEEEEAEEGKIRKSSSEVGKRKGREKEEEGIVKRLMDWIPQFQQHHQKQPPSNSAPAAAASSSSSGTV